jgi:hypothetical protein
MTHSELLTDSRAPADRAGCGHQVAKLGTWTTPGAIAKPLLIVSTFRCGHCAAIVEVIHERSDGLPRMRFRDSYAESQALWPKRSLL